MSALVAYPEFQNRVSTLPRRSEGNFVATITRKDTKNVMVLGILHIINAVLIVGIAVADQSYYLTRTLNVNTHGTSLCVPWIFITTGILGIFMYCIPSNKNLVVAHNIFAIISAVLTVPIIGTSAYAVKIYACNPRHSYKINYYYRSDYQRQKCRRNTDRQALHATLLALAIIQLILAVLSTYYSFKIFNCCKQGCPCQSCCAESNSGSPGNQIYQMQPMPLQNPNAQHQLYRTHQDQFYTLLPLTVHKPHQTSPETPSVISEFHYTPETSAISLVQQPLAPTVQQLPAIPTPTQTQIFIGPDGKQYALMPFNTQTTNNEFVMDTQATNPVLTSANTASTGNVPVYHSAFPSTASTGILGPIQSTEASTMGNATSHVLHEDRNETS